MRSLRTIIALGFVVWTSSLSSFELGGFDPLKITDILVKGVKSFSDVPEEKEIQIGKDLSAGLLGSTPLCLLPVARLDGRPIGDGEPGDVFRRLLAAWGEKVGLDIARQAEQFADRDLTRADS